METYVRRKTLDSGDVDFINGVEEIKDGQLSAGGIEVDPCHVLSASTDKLDRIKFMRDEITVYLNDATGENDPQFVELNVNGDYRLGVRGNEVKLRRYHVEVLAQAKQSRVRQKQTVMPDGSMGYIEENVLVLTYPFSVIDDPNPKKGGPWLRQLLSNPA